MNSPTATTAKEKNNEEQSKKTATSLILFEEVDVIFDDDSGFLAAIKTFMSTTKRPVILTTSGESYALACVDHMDFTSQIQKSWDIIENVKAVIWKAFFKFIYLSVIERNAKTRYLMFDPINFFL